MDELSRRAMLQAAAALGIGTVTFQRALASQLEPQDPPKKDEAPKAKVVTPEMVKNAEWIAGITLTEKQREQAAASLTGALRRLESAHRLSAPNSLAPTFHFDPLSALTDKPSPNTAFQPFVFEPSKSITKPDKDDDLSFASVAECASLLRAKKISSVELTKHFLARLEKYDPQLLCVVTRTDELALKQAKLADEEIAAGRFRGPLHGIPWGAKDLIAYPGYPTTWGAEHYKNQMIDKKAHVARKLDDAGAVLVAKLTMGALALGDRWFGGMTRNPWNNAEGSSGSSAGSCSAVAAGLVPFAIGTETLGSIISPSIRCGVTGLRPTFGRIGRGGCMTLSWTLDKLGPICRAAEDCALVLDAIHGTDPEDAASVSLPFGWPMTRPAKSFTVGYFEGRKAPEERAELKVFKELGCTLVPIKLPDNVPTEIVSTILDVESAAAFDDLTFEGISEGIGTWGATFRRGRFVSAVDYLRATRLRSVVMKEMDKIFDKVDCYIGGNDLVHTNLSGHPTLCLPNGPAPKTLATPPTMTITGKLYGETDLLGLAAAYQSVTDFHKQRPQLDRLKVLEKPPVKN